MEAEQFEFCSPEEYLVEEKSSETRHEYLNGTIHAMSGASRRHNRIAGSIFKAIESRIGDGPCETYIEDVKVHIKTSVSEFFYYPDVMVGCDPEDNHEYYLENPSLLFEVLSESTEQIDRREKLLAYQTIPSLDHYVIVSQSEILVDWIFRSETAWERKVLRSLDDQMEFPKQGMSLGLREIYAGVSFDPQN